jgi:hypothetical protein
MATVVLSLHFALTGRSEGMGRAEAILIFSEPKEKVYRIMFLKRRQLADNDSAPFGYVRDV